MRVATEGAGRVPQRRGDGLCHCEEASSPTKQSPPEAEHGADEIASLALAMTSRSSHYKRIGGS